MVSLFNLLALPKNMEVVLHRPYVPLPLIHIKEAKCPSADQLHALVPAQFQLASLLVPPSVAARD